MSAPAWSAELESAVDWMVLLSSGDATEQDRLDFERWRARDPRHAQAWQRVSIAVQGPFSAWNEGPERGAASHVLRHPPARRKVLRAMGVLARAGGGAAAVVDRQTPWRTLTADVRTGTGEQRSVTLPDGSELTLNARSAIDVDFSAGMRRVYLRTGAVHVRVAPDAARPFIVVSDAGEVQARGTIFGVTHHDREQVSIASVIEHSVEVRAAGQQCVVQAGEGVRFSRSRLGMPEAQLGDDAAWQRGMVVVHDEPLGTVLDALRPYRRGILRVTPGAARLRVLGAFPLGDTDRTLESLRQTLPIEVRSLGGWWVSIDLRDGSH